MARRSRSRAQKRDPLPKRVIVPDQLPTLGSRVTRTAIRYWPEVVVGLEVLLFFIPLVAGGRILFAGDLMYHWRPWNELYPYVRDTLGVYNPVISDPVNIGYPAYLDLVRNRASVMLLWDTSAYAGTPVQTIFWYPPLVLLFFLGVPAVVAPTLSMIVHALIAGLGFVRLARALRISAAGAALGATIYTWNSWMTTWLEYETIQRTFAWLPVAALLLLKAIRGGSTGSIIVAALPVALILSSGNLQFALYDLILLTAFALILAFRSPSIIGAGLRSGAVLLIGLALTTVFFMQQYHVLAGSTRGDAYVPTRLPLRQLTTLISPELFGNPVRGTSWGLMNYSEGTFYLGSAALVLPLLALFALRRRWGWLTAFALFILAGTAASLPLFDLIEAVPVVGSLAASRHLTMAIPLLALLAAYGADYIARPQRNLQFIRRAVVIAGGFSITLLCGALFTLNTSEWADVLSRFERAGTLRSFLLSNGLYVGSAAGTFAILLMLTRRHSVRLVGALIAIAFAELASVGWTYNTRIPPVLAYPTLPELEFIRAVPRKARVLGAATREAGAVYPPKTLRAYGFETVNGFGSFVPSRFANYVRVLEKAGSDFAPMLAVTIKNLDSPLLDAMNVVYVVNDRHELSVPEHFAPIYGNGVVEVLKNERAVPRAYFVPDVTSAATEVESLARLADPSWKPEETAIVEGWRSPARDFSVGTAQVVGYGPHSVTLATESVGEGFLVLTDSYDEGWRAYVDGRRTEIYRANSLFRGVAVPAGRHRVSFRYRPSYLLTSGVLSAGLLLLSGSLLLVARRLPVAAVAEDRADDLHASLHPSAVADATSATLDGGLGIDPEARVRILSARLWAAVLFSVPILAFVFAQRPSPVPVAPQPKPAQPWTIGVFDERSGTFLLRYSNTEGFADRIVNFGRAGDVPIAGDWDGDGASTPGVYRSSTGEFLLRNELSLGPPDQMLRMGAQGDIPVVGDWSGDGTTDFGIFRPSQALFILRSAAGEQTVNFGQPGDLPVAGDWNGDGVSQLGVFRPSSATFYLRFNESETAAVVVSPIPRAEGCMPVAGDWNGDGVSSVGVWCEGAFFLKNENVSGAADISFPYGTPAHLPVTGRWTR
jgi:hypothetical protein